MPNPLLHPLPRRYAPFFKLFSQWSFKDPRLRNCAGDLRGPAQARQRRVGRRYCSSAVYRRGAGVYHSRPLCSVIIALQWSRQRGLAQLRILKNGIPVKIAGGEVLRRFEGILEFPDGTLFKECSSGDDVPHSSNHD